MPSSLPAVRPEFSARPYVQLARIDHWYRNAFMLFGAVLAVFYRPEVLRLEAAFVLVGAFFITCVVASSNAVLNEYLDAPFDRLHPKKRFRSAPRGEVRGWGALLEWGVLGSVGIFVAFELNTSFGVAALALWLLGCLYSVPPVRTKDRPYIDVLSGSAIQPIRLLLGWLAFVPDCLPPLSLVLAYWMVAAYCLAAKRLAEYRAIGDPARAASYRSSFRWYDEDRLLVSAVHYLLALGLLSGIFFVGHRSDLIFCAPLVASFLAYTMQLARQRDSPLLAPERLYRDRGFVTYAVGVAALFLLLMSIEIPVLDSLLGVDADRAHAVWFARL